MGDIHDYARLVRRHFNQSDALTDRIELDHQRVLERLHMPPDFMGYWVRHSSKETPTGIYFISVLLQPNTDATVALIEDNLGAAEGIGKIVLGESDFKKNYFHMLSTEDANRRTMIYRGFFGDKNRYQKGIWFLEHAAKIRGDFVLTEYNSLAKKISRFGSGTKTAGQQFKEVRENLLNICPKT